MFIKVTKVAANLTFFARSLEIKLNEPSNKQITPITTMKR